MRGHSIGIVGRLVPCALIALLLGCDGHGNAQNGQQPAASAATSSAVTYLAQGWTADDRNTFYTTSQGSHLMPYAWFKALRRLDVDQPFAGDQLERYGYLRNDDPSNTNGLPVGFVAEASSGELGMTCAACHTGQLEYSKNGVTTVLRIDGAPASAADFQQFLLDLTASATQTLNQADKFDAFAKTVLGSGYSATGATQLKADFGAWVSQFSDFMTSSLPPVPWGPGRLDAFGMIFNRVAARDLNNPKNFEPANAPVSYPFLWNASRQDHTQWTGAVPNGLYIQGLARNTGEVFGVFADFAPRILIPGVGLIPTVIDYSNNSADFAGLQTLEEKIAVLQPPPWPADLFGLDTQLAAKGQSLFKDNCARGCHEEQTSPKIPDTWVTPVVPAETDPKVFNNSHRQSDPGIYTGALLPPPDFDQFQNPTATVSILAGSVVGSILDNLLKSALSDKKEQSGVWRAIQKDLSRLMPGGQNADVMHAQGGSTAEIQSVIKSQLKDLFKPPTPAGSPAAYEARVLHGIWATAPYLHNGSVPNLWELLKPPQQRIATFMVGSRTFDPKTVGFVTDQTPYKTGAFVSDPANANGNGGHNYGTGLSDDDRWAIIEYLKTL